MPRSQMWSTRRPHAWAQRFNKAASSVRRPLANLPRVVHHSIATTQGFHLRLVKSKVTQCIPGTNTGRPPGGLKYPGLMRFKRRALLERTAHKPSIAMLSDFPVHIRPRLAELLPLAPPLPSTRLLLAPIGSVRLRHSSTSYSVAGCSSAWSQPALKPATKCIRPIRSVAAPETGSETARSPVV
jgi:hypothetical protein